MRFDEPGIFWEPFRYVKQTKERSAPRPLTIPPIPDTGWVARENFPDLSGAKAISVDTETCDPELDEKGPGVRRGAHIVGVSLATDDGFQAYYPVAHSMGTNLDKDKVFSYLNAQLSRSNQPKVGANILYDLDFLAQAGVEVAGPFYDVLYADPLIYEYERNYNLDAVAERRLGLRKETSLLYQWCADAYGGQPNGDQRANIWRAPTQLVGPYAEQDAVLPLRIIREQVRLLRAMGANHIFDMECRLIPLLLHLRRRGVPVDLLRTKQVDDELTQKIDVLQAQVGIDVYAGEQIKTLCDAEGIEYPLTELGNPSFVKSWLEADFHTNPKMRAISDLRKLYKYRDAFIRGSILEEHIHGRVHTEFHPLRSDDYGTVSGRYSSSHPNLQQIPARDKYWGPRIRSCFVPSDGRVWMKNDMSQIEFRLGVHFGTGAGIEAVRELYRNDPTTDFYNVCVAITGVERQGSKSIALGSLYGMGYRKLARMYGMELEDARVKYETFHDRLPFMKATLKRYGDEAEQFGFGVTIGGRVYHIDPGYEYKALNRKLQGSCADWIKKSMLEAYERGLLSELELYLTVHDELDSGLLPTPAGVEAARELQRLMCSAYVLNVPVLAGCDLGSSWGELTETDPSSLTPELLARIASI